MVISYNLTLALRYRRNLWRYSTYWNLGLAIKTICRYYFGNTKNEQHIWKYVFCWGSEDDYPRKYYKEETTGGVLGKKCSFLLAGIDILKEFLTLRIITFLQLLFMNRSMLQHIWIWFIKKTPRSNKRKQKNWYLSFANTYIEHTKFPWSYNVGISNFHKFHKFFNCSET